MNKLQEMIADVGDTIHDALAYEFDQQKDSYEFETESNEVPYGDTYANEGNYITEESEEQFRESFSDDMSFEKIMDILKEDEQFKMAVMDLATYISVNREV